MQGGYQCNCPEGTLLGFSGSFMTCNNMTQGSGNCQGPSCALDNLLAGLQNLTAAVLPPNVVAVLLNTLSEKFGEIVSTTANDPTTLVTSMVTESLVSTLVKPTDTQDIGNLTTNTSDIDECSLGACSSSNNCMNTQGGYQCNCPEGTLLGFSGSFMTCNNMTQGSGNCQGPLCALDNLLAGLQNLKAAVLPPNVVAVLLNTLSEKFGKIVSSTAKDPMTLVTYGDQMLQVAESLVSTLVRPTDTQDISNLTTNTSEIQILSIGKATTVNGSSDLSDTYASLSIDLLGIAKKNNGSASVSFIIYHDMNTILGADLFHTENVTRKVMMSKVVSASLPKTQNKTLSSPVHFNFTYDQALAPNCTLSCVYWNVSSWVTDGCKVTAISASSAVCMCEHLSTFALIMEQDPLPEPNWMNLLNTVAVLVGIACLALAALTFVLCQRNPRVNNTARLNLCISLLLAHGLFLLVQYFLDFIRPRQVRWPP
uniref:Uncharacterized protein n=1 Tax=Denticeps clupeoides TaxID=299321 RepID=A0AAY4ADK5_9TELE